MADRLEQTETNLERNARVAFSEVEESTGVRDALVPSEPVPSEPVRWDLGRWEDDGGRVVG